MAAKLISLFWVFPLFLYPVKPDLDDGGPLLTKLTDGFSSERNKVSLDGVAVIDNSGILRLTNQSFQVVGHAFYKNPIKFKDSSAKLLSFSTAFAFAIKNEHGHGGHGFAFTISPTIKLPGALPGPYLGLFNNRNDGNFSNHIFAVEFDTVKDLEFGDIDDNHVGIDLNSIVSKDSIRVEQFTPHTKRKEDLNLKSGEKHTGLIVGVSVFCALVVILVTVLTFYIVRKIKKADVIEAWEFDISPHRFSYKELNKATKGFKDKELLGYGGFDRVCKGTLPNSHDQVAVKRICRDSKQSLKEFVSEVASIGCLRHRNLVQLLGWCRRQADLLLVYEFMPNGSLDKYLFDEPKAILSWEQRERAALRFELYGLQFEAIASDGCKVEEPTAAEAAFFESSQKKAFDSGMDFDIILVPTSLLLTKFKLG
ncbi:L-type lectin-domain containing receptor kinase S.4-like [Fagus crenata]